jgi:tetratricopeptide (TPR) repeat protein
MMLETVREYAQERLDADLGYQTLRQRHARYYLMLAETAEPHLTGPQQTLWLNRLKADYENIRTALSWALECGETETFARLCGALWRFWFVRGYWSEGQQWLESALTSNAMVPVSVQIRVLVGASAFALYQNDHVRSKSLIQAGLNLRPELGDNQGIANSLIELGTLYSDQGDYEQAFVCFEECLKIRQSIGDWQGVASVLNNMGNMTQDLIRSSEFYLESLRLRRMLEDQQGIAASLNNLGLNAYYQDDYAQSATLLSQSLEIFQNLNDQLGIANALSNLGQVALVQGDIERATGYLTRSLALFCTLNNRQGIAECLEQLAGANLANVDIEVSVQLLGAAEALRDKIGVPLTTVERVFYEWIVDSARTRMDPELFRIAWATGRTLSLERAVAQALGEDESRAVLRLSHHA